MFGTREEFSYIECSACGTVQIASVPDLAAYYPSDYYSLVRSIDTPTFQKIHDTAAMRPVGSYLINGRGIVGKLLSHYRPHLAERFPKWLLSSPHPIRLDTKILDYGCGGGELLRRLSDYGFSDLTGADAFIDREVSYRGINIYKRSLDQLEPSFDLIMLHHSFEHLPEPKAALNDIARLLSPDGTALIRIPLINYAWQKYGVNWVQLDPPRHLFLFTERSFEMIADEAGLRVESVVYDSEAFQFHGSEQYMMGISMHDERTFIGVSDDSIFDRRQIDAWTREAVQLNKESRGDQACFYLKRKA